ncbi:HAD family hydrolase [Flavobacterium sp. ACAM 123]|uniref:HAD family hydrolase n=1 Tax=Flavobacterium sp. ACAM 123 TaxID=1189620 RepID=UPI0002F92727|nr:HAD family hydrolase [Flavobacterium sp. ACAM 123]
MKFKAVIFDLDGTLINSLEDIADSMNTVLKTKNYPTHNYEAYNYFIGSGIRNLVAKALPDGHSNEHEIERCFEALMSVYRGNCIHKTIPYEGIIKLLDNLIDRQLKLCVLSNKSDALTKKIVSELFPGYFESVIGLTTEELKKPNPFTAVLIGKGLGFTPQEIMYIGDSGVDMQTANNAAMYPVGVSWGYRPKEELLADGAKHILDHPLDLIELL